MILKENQLSTLSTWMYLERKVNKGSPSGFGGLNDKFNVGKRYNPFSDNISFELFTMNEPKSQELGEITSSLKKSNISLDLYIHPEMADFVSIKNDSIVKKTNLMVEPTSSSRTVFAKNIFIKLHYDGIIGRVNRSIEHRHAISSIELTNILKIAVDSQLLPKTFYYLQEPYARTAVLKDNYQISCIFRETEPYPRNNDIRWIIPLFSLFSKDKCRTSDKLLLQQLIELSGLKADKFILERIITPLIDNYFSAILQCGLQFELQAQNCLLALDGDFNVLGTIFRDLESADKDIQIIKDNNLSLYKENNTPNYFSSFPYKCIWKDYRFEQQESYKKKHSFMFDFKFGEYILKELVDCSVLLYGFNRELMNESIRNITREYTRRLPTDFFPDGCWYYYDNIVLDRKEGCDGKVPPKPFIMSCDVKYR